MPARRDAGPPAIMNMERFIHHVRVELPVATEQAAEARARLGDKFPRTALRRMTHLGMLLGSTLEGVTLTPEDAVVYASSYAETRALEDFLSSFPQASPLLFQTSIHPGGVQQVLIGRQQPVARLWPLAGRARLVEQALLTALLEPAARAVLLGGEERGSWLLEQGYASDRAFAFAAVLTRDAAGATGRITWTEQRGTADDTCPVLVDFASALAERRPISWHAGGGEWSIQWS